MKIEFLYSSQFEAFLVKVFGKELLRVLRSNFGDFQESVWKCGHDLAHEESAQVGRVFETWVIYLMIYLQFHFLQQLVYFVLFILLHMCLFISFLLFLGFYGAVQIAVILVEILFQLAIPLNVILRSSFLNKKDTRSM